MDERKKIAKNYISDLMVLNTKEKEYIDRFEEKKYMPELLFEDAEIVERVKNHQWHYGNVRSRLAMYIFCSKALADALNIKKMNYRKCR